ncbi:leukocyte cell-derived chemotaxin 1 [Betta splendens]|uniref:Leukocyte cell-derived chemotaxin 1 n=1 Tax=Betta splendens TaxID=158456 RepID=A0A8M1H8L7_BETSP|nr:leukocyte cell-derived chemotaxin 1 [Betta splendens]
MPDSLCERNKNDCAGKQEKLHGAGCFSPCVSLSLCFPQCDLHNLTNQPRFARHQVYSVRYSANMDGEAREGSVEMDSDNNLERFETGNGAGEAVETRDFQTGITGIRFVGGDKCYIKSQIKGSLPHMGAHNKESLMSDLTDKLTPARSDDGLVWAAGEQPLKDTSFLSNHCRDLPIHRLQPTSPKACFPLFSHLTPQQMHSIILYFHGSFRSRKFKKKTLVLALKMNTASILQRSGGAGDKGAVTFDPALDHRGVRCYTHCQRTREPPRGRWPWPCSIRGCQVACRVIMPCRWWVARFLGAA